MLEGQNDLLIYKDKDGKRQSKLGCMMKKEEK